MTSSSGAVGGVTTSSTAGTGTDLRAAPAPASAPAPAPAHASGPAGVTEPAYATDTSACFAHSCQETLTIDCATHRVYEALFRVERWPAHLPHVQRIEVLYDDGRNQEFWMTVASENGGAPARVRSVRACRFPQIEFFQPQPPPFLRHHAGVWRFTPEGDACRVTVSHLWNLEPAVAAERFPDRPGHTTAQQVADLLAGHSRLALSSWRKVLGSGREA